MGRTVYFFMEILGHIRYQLVYQVKYRPSKLNQEEKSIEFYGQLKEVFQRRRIQSYIPQGYVRESYMIQSKFISYRKRGKWTSHFLDELFLI